jgi:hypothetical protein
MIPDFDWSPRSPSEIPGVSILRTLDDVSLYDYIGPDFVPSEESKRRVQELGLQALFTDNQGRTVQLKLKRTEQLEILEGSVWKLAAHVKTRRFGIGYKKEDFKNSLNFLESFCFYSAQAHLVHKDDLKLKNDKNVLNAVREIEKIHKLLESDLDKAAKRALSQHVERVNHLITRIFNEDLNRSEQHMTVDVVERAKKILEKVKKSL